MKSKKVIIGVLCVTLLIMAVGYAAFSTNLNISGTANVTSTWKILFTNIEEVSKTSGVTVKNTPTASGTTATFDVGLNSPGDEIIYKITVANQGTLNAIIDKIKVTELGSDAIKFEIEGINEGDKLGNQKSATFTVTISYDSNISSQPDDVEGTLSVEIDYVQDLGQSIPSNEPTIIKVSKLSEQILKNNVAQSDSSIDFSKASSDTNGKGLYYTNVNTEGDRTTYYFRGAVNNNYVYFGGYYWRIVRINEDESIRLIYQGESATQETATIGASKFNELYDDNAHVGYMYGDIEADNYKDTHANINSSTIKGTGNKNGTWDGSIDDWYVEYLIDYSSYIADAGFCSDRSVAPSEGLWNSSDTALGYGTNRTYYGAYNRLVTNKAPQFKCPNAANDLFTLKGNTQKGNAALDYPIGLITADEAIYTGSIPSLATTTSYLKTSTWFWTMSPRLFGGSDARVWTIQARGGLNNYRVDNSSSGVRPAINLKSTVEITDGTQDGTVGNEYTIKVN